MQRLNSSPYSSLDGPGYFCPFIQLAKMSEELVGILIGTALDLQINLGRNQIFIILFPHECAKSTCLGLLLCPTEFCGFLQEGLTHIPLAQIPILIVWYTGNTGFGFVY